MDTHPPIEHIQCHSVTIRILWRAHGVGGGGVFGGFVGWVIGGFMGCGGVWWCGWWWGGWLESSWVGEYMHPPHQGVLGMKGSWTWVGGYGHDGWVGMGMTGRWV